MVRKSAAILLTLVAVLAAGWLALRRPDIPYEALESSYSVEASRFLNVKGDTKIHYTDTGPRDAPVVLLVHGFSASLHTWRPWVRQLEDTYRVITLDLPGHGLSRVPEDEPVSIDYFVDTVDALADRMQVASFTIVGSSMGGNVAWQYALAHPERLDSLVLVDASGWPDESNADEPIIFRLLNISVARTLMKDLDLSGLIEDGLKDSVVDPAIVSTEMIERYSALSRAPGHRDALLQLSAGRGKREKASKQRLSAINVPTLILWGEQDKVIPVSDAARFEDAIPNSVVITYPEAGHIPQEELPEETLADLEAFLERHVNASDVAVEPLDGRALSERPQAQQATGGGMRPR
ncbi:MAG: alpha/beta hydrolase [Pseudomonadota bacterium]|nr:alpha/beta hydrolase [Pseudomonadota bacterium]